MGSFSLFRCLLLFHIFLSASVALTETLGVETATDTDHRGFNVELIHCDSPRSPFYVASETPAERASKAIRRSFSRLTYFSTTLLSKTSTHHATSSSPPIFFSGLAPGTANNDYLMTINVGRPPVKRVVIADTGSGLNWVQCQPCKACYKQDYPLFDPRKSSTYRVLDCKTDLCKTVQDGPATLYGVKGQCRYNFSYGDLSVTQGELGSETFIFETAKKTTVRIPNVPLGCSYNTTRGKLAGDVAGLAGLRLDKTSLVTQIGPHVRWRFSFCLVPHTLANASSVLSFGDAARVRARGAVSFPFSQVLGPVYAVNLSKISVGKNKSVRLARRERSVVLDTGTHLTILPKRVVIKVAYYVSTILGPGNVDDPTGNSFYATRYASRRPPSFQAWRSD
ncbi:hypothetical protein H6P81_001276 [Aristolochia fimbriata]|uniref:Peptidase A1 domain-containing protein n=1 Tax=Aristolochia fimbriata TaxID=158543 RepID=A0AAV7FB06_ARIFI|nr:hypothetical protein H6P81_001276 [Aristolochia fimbriata]